MNFYSLITFAIVANITPGPSNISSANMGLNFGYKKTLNYLSGITFGVFIMLSMCSLLTSLLMDFIPFLERMLSILGAIYILYLSYKTFRTSYNFKEEHIEPFGFIKGVLIQLLNPKAVIFGITVYSTFLKNLSMKSPAFILSLIVFPIITFISNSIWSLLGTIIKTSLRNKFLHRLINITLTLLLIITAIQIFIGV